MTARQAARAALQEDAAALLVDVAGPVTFVVEGDELRSLAGGDQLTRLDGGRWGWLQAADSSAERANWLAGVQ